MELDLPVAESFPAVQNVEFPVLITHSWCPFTTPIIELWKKVASHLGVPLTLVSADSDLGSGLISKFEVHGVPCLLLNAKVRRYGPLSEGQAMEILESSL